MSQNLMMNQLNDLQAIEKAHSEPAEHCVKQGFYEPINLTGSGSFSVEAEASSLSRDRILYFSESIKLREQLSLAQEKRQSFYVLSKKLRAEIVSLKCDLEKSQNLIEELVNEKLVLKKDLKSRSLSLINLRESHDCLDKAYHEKNHENDDLKSKLVASELSLEKLSAEISLKDHTYSEKLVELKQSLLDLRKNRSKVSESLERLKFESGIIKLKHEKRIEDILALSGRIDSINAEFSFLDESRNALYMECNALKQKIHTLTFQNESLREELVSCSDLALSLKEKNKNYRSYYVNLKAKINSLTEINCFMEEKNSLLEKRLNTRLADIYTLNNYYEALILELNKKLLLADSRVKLIRSSFSWKVTSPLRKIGSFIKRIIKRFQVKRGES